MKNEIDTQNNKETLIILGFPGIGKSTFAENYIKHNILTKDTDISKFKYERNGELKSDFPRNYVEYIKTGIGHIDVILGPLDIDVIAELTKEKINHFIVYPEKHLKNHFIKRYLDKGHADEFVCTMINSFDMLIYRFKTMKSEYQEQYIITKPDNYLDQIIIDIAEYLRKKKINNAVKNQYKKFNNIDPVEIIAPGKYNALWSAFYVVIVFDDGKLSKEIKVNKGVKGINCECKVEVDSEGNLTIL